MKKILLVDDEDSIHLLYREELEEEGYEVHSALSGEEALTQLKII
ncbi:MAG: two-component system response regulator, partial [Deltaproteobacteria bacterium HGW-Deltaproteobacteria-16]